MDFFALKGAVEAILGEIRAANVTFEAPQIPNPSYHPGRCAQVLANGQEVGVFGQIHPLVAQNYGVDAEFYCAELDFDQLMCGKGPIPSTCPCPSSLPSPGISPWCAAKRSPWEPWRTASVGGRRDC